MRILLDTHVWVWMILEPHKVGRRLMRELDSSRNDLFLSPISVWEAQRATSRSRGIRLNRPFHQWVERALKAAPVHEAPITFAVATEAASLILPHPGPGDIFIAATAIVHGLTLATAGEQLLACRAVKTIPNT